MGTDWKKELIFFLKKIIFSNFPSYHLLNFLMLRNKQKDKKTTTTKKTQNKAKTKKILD